MADKKCSLAVVCALRAMFSHHVGLYELFTSLTARSKLLAGEGRSGFHGCDYVRQDLRLSNTANNT